MKQEKKASITHLIPQEVIENKIFLIRGKKIMLDRNLAILYEVPPKRLNEQVKRNIKRFPWGFHVPINKRGSRFFKVAICDLKKRAAFEVLSFCLY